jgi:hypothetical protein
VSTSYFTRFCSRIVAVSAINSSWAIILVSWLKITDISGAVMVLATSVIFKQLTCLIAREDFITSSHHESFRSYSVCDICIPSFLTYMT